MQTEDPIITIGITCYREGDWLSECWESVLAQTDHRWEAVLVMDGGADTHTREIFEHLSHPKLRKFAFSENVGPYPARNKAFELTQTPYHFYLDADDELVPNSVALVLDGFAQVPAAGCIYGDTEIFGAATYTRQYPAYITADDLIEGIKPIGACAFRKDVWEQLGGYAAELASGCGDFDFHMGMMELGIPWHHCGAVFYRYRVGHSTKVSSSYLLRFYEKIELMAKRHPVFFHDQNRLNRFIAWGYRESAYENYRAGNLIEACRLANIAVQQCPADGKLMRALAMAGGLSQPWQQWVIMALAAHRKLTGRT